jgi:hypothetical protein
MSEKLSTENRQTWIIIGVALLIVARRCVGVVLLAGKSLFSALPFSPSRQGDFLARSTTAELTVAVSPGMASTFNKLVEVF